MAGVIFAGALRYRIEIQRPVYQMMMGGERKISAWETFAVRRCSVEDLAGSEKLQASQEMMEVTTKFVIRYLSGLEPSMRILYGSSYYGIQSISDIGVKEGHEILAIKKQ